MEALETLGADNGRAVSRLLALLKKDKDSRVRKAAALALGHMRELGNISKMTYFSSALDTLLEKLPSI